MEGKLIGATDGTDYFYFICPRCADDRILRVLDYEFSKNEPGNSYNAGLKGKATCSFICKLDIFCENCGFRDCVKVSNVGWQEGVHKYAPRLAQREQKPPEQVSGHQIQN